MDHVIVAANQLDKIKVQATQTQVDLIKAQVTVADAQDAQDAQADQSRESYQCDSEYDDQEWLEKGNW